MAFSIQVEVAQNNYSPIDPKIGDTVTHEGEIYVVTDVQTCETTEGLEKVIVVSSVSSSSS